MNTTPQGESVVTIVPLRTKNVVSGLETILNKVQFLTGSDVE